MTYTTGRVIDLVSNDVQRLEETKWPFVLLKAKVEVAVITALLYSQIGWQALMGVAFLIFLVPYFGLLSFAAGALRLRTAAVSDRRISLMNEILSGIRTIKTHAWEDEYRKKIKVTRRYDKHLLFLKSIMIFYHCCVGYGEIFCSIIQIKGRYTCMSFSRSLTRF